MKKILLRLQLLHRVGDREETETLLWNITLKLQAEMTAQERVFLSSFRRNYPFLRAKIYRLLEIHRSVDLILDDLDRTLWERNSEEWDAKLAYLSKLLSLRKNALREAIFKPLLTLEENAREWLFRSYRKARSTFTETILGTFVTAPGSLSFAQ